MMRVLIVTGSLAIGGTMKSLMNLLEAIKEQNSIEIDLLFLKGDRRDIRKKTANYNISEFYICRLTDIYFRTFQEQSKKINKVIKFIMGLSCRILTREAVIRSIVNLSPAYSDYDAAISYSTGIWTNGRQNFSGGCEFYVLNRIKAKKKIAWIHSNPESLGITRDIALAVFSHFDRIVNVSWGCKEIFDAICPELSERDIVFYNLCDVNKIRNQALENNPYLNRDGFFNIVTVCRLDNRTKRIDRAIETANILKFDAIRPFVWHIIGDGKDFKYLKNLVEEKCLNDVVVFEGMKENPYPYMKNADLYVSTSDIEAFGITIKEALILGIPAVITPIPSADELIENGKTGFITDFSSATLANRIELLMSSSNLLNDMKQRILLSKHSESIDGFLEIISN